jgi:PPOX class probable F420-dependent enzyme
MPNPIPPEIRGQRYISLTTFRKNGAAIPVPVWFAERDDKLYVMTRSNTGKYKRIRNNPQVRVAPCTIRGKVTGPEFSARARILPPADWQASKQLIRDKYWLARVPVLWRKQDGYFEITFE